MRGWILEIWLENRRGGSTIGIGEACPRISCVVDAEADPKGIEAEVTYFDGQSVSHLELSQDGRLLPWPFQPLRSRQSVELRLRTQFRGGGASPWSDAITVEAGLLSRDDWTASFVSPSPNAPPGDPRPAYLLRAEWDARELGLDVARIARARIYATAHGVYEVEMNGFPVSDELLSPGWTSYRHRLRHQTYDVTALIQPGQNVVGAWLADGWYRGRVGFNGGRWDYYGPDVALLLQIEVTLDDGSMVPVPLNDCWRWTVAPVTATGLYEGETYDARLEPKDWSKPGFDATAWSEPHRFPLSGSAPAIEAPTSPPVREVETINPVAVQERPNGRIQVDFGQNIAGRLRIRPRGPRGHEIRLHHAEVLEGDELATRPLRTATAIDTYICRGDGEESWSPRFTYHGYRYAEIENWPGGLSELDVEAQVVHSDMPRTGWFECSHQGLNRLHENIVWSMRGNFVHLPTDCPQRDERLGWTGDIQLFAPTALYLFACHGLLSSWLRDLAAEQADQGHVPNFVPWIDCGFPNHPTAAWGDAAVIVPWEMYRHDGDSNVLARQYDSMRAWVDLVDSLTHGTGLWNEGFQLGDWLDPAAPADNPGESRTNAYLVATAYHVKTARILADVARILGLSDDHSRYSAVAQRATDAFRANFIHGDGRVLSDTVTAISLCLVFNLLADSDQQRAAGRRLIELVRAADFHITTGFVGTPIVCDALVKAGSVDAAYRLLLQDEFPSWVYPVMMGATTVWERWDSMRPDGSLNPSGMTSFNHYAFGAVADFMHRVVAGLDHEGAGWSSLRVAPHPGGGLSHASTRHNTPLGMASVAWHRMGERFELEVEVPHGAKAAISIPGRTDTAVGPGRHTISSSFRAPADD